SPGSLPGRSGKACGLCGSSADSGRFRALGRRRDLCEGAGMTSMDASISRAEIMIGAITRMLQGLRHVAVGNSSPIPGSAALLARALSGGRLRVSLLGSRKHNAFTDGGRELFDCAAQGRIDAFFLSGGQIDGQAN